jgi:hypothetical protein
MRCFETKIGILAVQPLCSDANQPNISGRWHWAAGYIDAARCIERQAQARGRACACAVKRAAHCAHITRIAQSTRTSGQTRQMQICPNKG